LLSAFSFSIYLSCEDKVEKNESSVDDGKDYQMIEISLPDSEKANSEIGKYEGKRKKEEDGFNYFFIHFSLVSEFYLKK
jgi:hypothetical protein